MCLTTLIILPFTLCLSQLSNEMPAAAYPLASQTGENKASRVIGVSEDKRHEEVVMKNYNAYIL